jgi:hypothetical protein
VRKLAFVVAFAGAATIGCGGGDDEQPSSTSSAPVGAIITAGASSSASPLGDPAEAALAAAIELLEGVSEADCTTNNPERADCIAIDASDREGASFGVAALSVEGPAGGSSVLLMGREPDGNWAYYAGGQQYYQASKLPGEMTVCTQGTGLNVRAEASATAQLVRTVEDNSTVSGEEFVLTQPGTPPTASPVPGYGWYRISAPVEGWVYSKYVSGLADCSLHDSLETP